MIEQNGYTYFKTIKDLKEHIGDTILYSYMDKDKEVIYMKKLTDISKEYYTGKKLNDDDAIPQGLMTYGTHMVVLKTPYPNMKTPRILYFDKEEMSNRFEVIRIPTKKEMNIYRNMLRYYRIFGNKFNSL